MQLLKKELKVKPTILGLIYKNKNQWLAEVPGLGIMTQGKTRKEAIFMTKDAISEYVKYYFKISDFEVIVSVYKKTHLLISSENEKLLEKLQVIKKREREEKP